MNPHARRALRLRLLMSLRAPLAFICAIALWTGALVFALATAGEGRWVTVEATAYCGGPCEKCETTGVTANGTETIHRPYGVASSPNIGLGSMVFIPSGAGYVDQTFRDRWFVCDDRGGALRSEWRRSGITRLDLRYRTHASAQQFGRKLMLVFITD